MHEYTFSNIDLLPWLNTQAILREELGPYNKKLPNSAGKPQTWQTRSSHDFPWQKILIMIIPAGLIL